MKPLFNTKVIPSILIGLSLSALPLASEAGMTITISSVNLKTQTQNVSLPSGPSTSSNSGTNSTITMSANSGSATATTGTTAAVHAPSLPAVLGSTTSFRSTTALPTVISNASTTISNLQSNATNNTSPVVMTRNIRISRGMRGGVRSIRTFNNNSN